MQNGSSKPVLEDYPRSTQPGLLAGIKADFSLRYAMLRMTCHPERSEGSAFFASREEVSTTVAFRRRPPDIAFPGSEPILGGDEEGRRRYLSSGTRKYDDENPQPACRAGACPGLLASPCALRIESGRGKPRPYKAVARPALSVRRIRYRNCKEVYLG